MKTTMRLGVAVLSGLLLQCNTILSLFGQGEEESPNLTALAALLLASQSSSSGSSTSLCNGIGTVSSRTSPEVACTLATSHPDAVNVPSWIRNNFTCVVTANVSGTTFSIQTRGLPDHKSAYWTDSNKKESMPSGRSANPNTITNGVLSTVNFWKDPAAQANTGAATDLSHVGIAVNGVYIYNNSAAAPDTLSEEISTLDKGNGHPTNTEAFHYHIEPCKVSSDDSSLVGIIRDGYPVYGKKDEDGTYPTNLDATTHGHSHTTNLFPSGIFHYHVTDSDPYIISNYRGTKTP
ncbi:MAG: YHYH protein [Spirochaetales bacterium]|nr:YHYH protein [Spirochaetales bacterium]